MPTCYNWRLSSSLDHLVSSLHALLHNIGFSYFKRWLECMWYRLKKKNSNISLEWPIITLAPNWKHTTENLELALASGTSFRVECRTLHPSQCYWKYQGCKFMLLNMLLIHAWGCYLLLGQFLSWFPIAAINGTLVAICWIWSKYISH